jgi:aspartyl-tRNA(Asn)/glutamyl-tRNA(Gln) amidotransferase subunit C
LCIAPALILCGNPAKTACRRIRAERAAIAGIEPPARTFRCLRRPTLARIRIDATQAEEVRAQLDAIFVLINQLTAVDTTGVEPMAHAQDVTLALRDDMVTETDASEAYQRLAPDVADGLYLVPKVIE